MFSHQRVSPPMVLLVLAASVSAEPVLPSRDRFGDPLPDGAVARLGNLRLRPDSPVLSGAFSPDGKILATIGANGAITCWDTANGKETRQVPVKLPGPARELRFSVDGKSLILAGGGGLRKEPAVGGSVLRVVDAVTGAEQRKLDSPDHAEIRALEVAKDGKTAVSIHAPGTIVVWDLTAGQPLHAFKDLSENRLWHFSPGQLTALTPDGKQLVLPHADGSLHLRDVATGKEVLAFEMPPQGPARPVNRTPQKVAVSPDGRYLAYAGNTNAAALCDLKTGKRVHEFAPFRGSTVGLAFTPNSRFLIVYGLADVRVFGVVSGKELRHFSKPMDTRSIVAFAPDRRMLASLGGSTLLLWDLAAGRLVHPTAGHQSPLQALTFFPDGKRLVSAGRTDGFLVWDIAAGRDIAHQRFFFPYSSSNPFTVAGDGDTLQHLGTDLAIHRWNPTTSDDERRPLPRSLTSHQLTLSPDGRTVAALTFTGAQQLTLHDLRGSKTARTLGLPNNVRIIQVMFSPDSRRLTASTTDGVLHLWDRDSGRLLSESKPEVKRGHPTHMAFAADGRSIALFDGDLWVREVVSGGDRFHLSTPPAVSALAYSPNGRFLVCGHLDGSITVHDTAAGKQRTQWQGRQGVVHALAFSRDSRLLASGGENGTILVWKVSDGEDLPAELKAEEAVAFWQALAADDAARANRALAGLAAAPAQALPLIKERFRIKAVPPSPERLARLIAELDDDSFKVRERATRELSEAGPDAADALRKALAKDPSAETRRRIESLLKRLQKGGDPEHLRSLRAIEVLERIGTPRARDALRELAEKDLGTTLREEVRATLRRMDSRR